MMTDTKNPLTTVVTRGFKFWQIYFDNEDLLNISWRPKIRVNIGEYCVL
jgi:hypothetical protein